MFLMNVLPYSFSATGIVMIVLALTDLLWTQVTSNSIRTPHLWLALDPVTSISCCRYRPFSRSHVPLSGQYGTALDTTRAQCHITLIWCAPCWPLLFWDVLESEADHLTRVIFDWWVVSQIWIDFGSNESNRNRDKLKKCLVESNRDRLALANVYPMNSIGI